MKYKYKIFGYDVASDIEIDAYETNFEQPEITIIVGTINKQFLGLIYEQVYFSEKDKRVCFYVPQTGIFEVTDGKKIMVEPDEGAIDSEIQLFILGIAFGFLMNQMDVFPIHGSTVNMGTSCLTFIGHSGAGKSSLAAGFVERRFQLLTDDVSRIGLIKNVHHVYASYPSQKMCEDTVRYMEIDHDPQKRVMNRMNKIYVNDRSRFSIDVKPIGAVIEIFPSEVSDPLLIRLEKREALQALITHSYAKELMGQCMDLVKHFRFCSELAITVPVYRLIRPLEGFTVREQVDILIDHFEIKI